MAQNKPKAVVSWSSGKDSAYALYELQRSQGFDLVGIVTTISSQYGRVSMHGVRESLVDLQAKSLGLPVFKVYIPSPCTNEVYEAEMAKMIATLRNQGVSHFAFGDLFLADIRAYRESRLSGTHVQPLFPLWLRDTKLLAREMISSGLRARITCVDSNKLDSGFAGREFNDALLSDLPPHVDPCGENGEFHTLAYEGPMFTKPIPITGGEIIERDGFIFADVIPR